MKPFERAVIPPEEIKRNIELMFAQWKDPASAVRQLYKESDPDKAFKEISDTITNMVRCDEIWLNEVYQVNVRRLEDGTVHLSIKRIDKQPCNDWRDFQEIKNQLVGRECEAVQLYPAESRVVDTANQYHLWCSSNPKFRFPLGWNAGRVVTNGVIGKSEQRPHKQSVTSPVAA